MNPATPLHYRKEIAHRVRSAKESLAKRIDEEFFERPPDWKARYGERGITRIEDACFHLDFLTSAIEAGTVSSFIDYVIWARRMLEARGIGAAFLEEHLHQLGVEASSLLEPSKQACVAEFIEGGVLACTQDMPALNPSEPETNIFVLALLAGNRKAALNVAKEFLAQGLTVPEVYLKVLNRR